MRHRVADGVGDVDRRRALVDRDLAHLGRELDVGAGRVHRRELDVVDVLLGVRDRRARLPLDVLARGLELVLMWMSDVEMNVWIRGRVASLTAFHAASMSATWVRASPAITGPSTVREIACTASKSPGEVIGKPASMTSTPSRASWWAISSFSCVFSEMPGRLLAVTQRRVEDQYSAGVFRFGHVTPSCARTCFFSVLVRGYVRPPTRYSPRGGRRRSRRSRRSAMPRKAYAAEGPTVVQAS